MRTEPARQRFGTYVDRTAFGPDLYADGRAAVLRMRGRRGRTTAGEHLRSVVDLLADRLTELLSTDDLAALRAVAAGTRPLPPEGSPAEAGDGSAPPLRPLDLRGRRTSAVRVDVVSATWWAYVVRLEGAGRTRWLTVPAEWARDFFTQLTTGTLDDVLAELVAGRRLDSVR